MKKLSNQQQVICGLDIGTTKIAAVIAEQVAEGPPRLLGMGCVPSRGLRRGVVVNLDHTASDIEDAVQIAEDKSGISVDRVWAGLAGEHVRSVNSRGVIPVSKTRGEPTGEVSEFDVERVVDAARAIALPMDRRVLHVLPQEYSVDSECGIRVPVGMAGVRLEADVHIVTCAISSAQNIIACCKRAGLSVQNLVLEPLASADGVLTNDERELGVVLLDFGGGTTDLAVFHNGSIRHTAVIGYGGDYISRDIAMGLRTPVESAEIIKINHGAAHHRAIQQNDCLTIPGVGGREPRELSRSMLVSIISPRVEEILTMARDELKQSRTLEHIGAGVVLTGGGASMPGMAEIAEEIFALPVRIGAPIDELPENLPGPGPKYATAIGLIRYADACLNTQSGAAVDRVAWPGRSRGKVKKWLSEIF
jgi:cell division protein FtsA